MYINKQSNIQKKDLVSTKTASGNPVVISDCAGGKARSLKTTIEAIQDLHGYDKPWAGGAYKNFIDYSARHNTTVGVTYTDNPYSGELKVDYASGGQHQLVLSVPNVDKLKGQQVTISVDSVVPSNSRTNDWRIFLLTYINGASEAIVATLTSSTLKGTITLANNITEMRLLLRMSQGGSSSLQSGDYVTFNKVQLELGGDKTSYAPYSNICPISGRTEAVLTRSDGDEISEDFTIQLGTTVYGADINWDTGVVTVTHVILNLGNLNWELVGGTRFVADNQMPNVKIDSSYNTPRNAISSQYVWVAGDTLFNTDTYGYSYYIENSKNRLFIKDLRYATAADFKTAMDGVQLCYELATPTTLQLTPTQLQMLKGVNRVSIDNGSIELEYVPDNLAGDIISLVEEELEEINTNIGLGETVSANMANCLPPRFKDISNDYYNGNLKAEIAAGNFRNVRPGDYIIGSSTGSKYVVGACDYWYNKGDTACTTHHLRLMLVEVKNISQLWAGLPYDGGTGHWAGLNRCPWNAAVNVDPTSASAVGSNSTNISRTITISGTGTASPTTASASGYAGSFIRDRLIARLLPDCFVADFGSANVLLCRNLNGNAVTTDKPSAAMSNWNGMTSGWTWMDSQIELPSEVELYGTMVFSSSAMDVGCQDQQLALFRNVSIEQVVGRTDVWTKAVVSSTGACLRNYYGGADRYSASYAFCALPLANVK